jgi:hypothetical protein
MSNLTTLSLDQLLYFNGIATIIDDEKKKTTYSVEINYSTDDKNLLTSKVQLILKVNKKVITIFNLDKLLLIREDKNNFASDDLNLSIFDNLIESLSIESLNRVDQNLYIFCQLLTNHIQEDTEKNKIVIVNRDDLFNLVIETGKNLESLNFSHTLEFSRLYRTALRLSTVKK